MPQHFRSQFSASSFAHRLTQENTCNYKSCRWVLLSSPAALKSLGPDMFTHAKILSIKIALVLQNACASIQNGVCDTPAALRAMQLLRPTGSGAPATKDQSNQQRSDSSRRWG